MTTYSDILTNTARKSTLDCITSDAFLLSDFVEKNNIAHKLENYATYAYIDGLDSHDYIEELIRNTPEEYSKYNVSTEQLKRIVDSINDETYFDVVNEVTKEVIEFRNKVLATENTTEVSVEEKSEIKEDVNNEEVVADATVESNDSDNDKIQNDDASKTEKKALFDNLKEVKNTDKKPAFRLFAGLRKSTESTDEEESSQTTVAYQPAVANNLYGNTGVTDQVVFTPESDFKTPEEMIRELYNKLVMETDMNKMHYIVNQIINLVPDKERFIKMLSSKSK